MTHGIDTDFLVAGEIRDHPFHRQADALVRSLLAATYRRAGIRRLLSNNEAGFRIFGCFELVTFR